MANKIKDFFAKHLFFGIKENGEAGEGAIPPEQDLGNRGDLERIAKELKEVPKPKSKSWE